MHLLFEEFGLVQMGAGMAFPPENQESSVD